MLTYCLPAHVEGNLVIYDANGTPTWNSNTKNEG